MTIGVVEQKVILIERIVYMRVHNKVISFVVILSIVFSMLLITPFSVSAESTKPQTTIQLNATCYYDDAFEILDRVNELRSANGLHKLSMEPQLMEDAMQRAAELMVYYEHTRPDSTDCFDINEDAFAENIAMGYGSPQAVMNGWVNSTIHYANIMSNDFNCIGIGAVVHNGVPCWVQLFGIKPYAEEIETPENITKDFDIFLGDNEYELFMDVPESLFVGDSAQLQIKGQTINNVCYYTLNNDKFTFSSSDNTVVSIENDKAVAVGVGNATITATSDFVTISTNIEVDEFSAGNSHQCGDNVFWEYKDGTLTLTGTGDMYEYNAYYDDNYDIVSDVPYFEGCENVKKVVVSEGVTGISPYAFAGFEQLESVEFPTTLQTIGREAFLECYKLNSVNMQEGIKEIPFGCFDTCFSLKSITLPQSVESIGNNAFLYCTGLESIQLPEKISYIAGGAFFGCRSLKEITLPETISIIESGTFNQCDSLKKVTILNPNVRFGVYNMFSPIADTLTIYGYNNSTAATHCKNNSINFVSLGDSPDLVVQIIGDVNLDGVVNILDVTTLQRFLAQMTYLEYDAVPLADTNKDGDINISDATQIQRFIAQIIPEL